jgi:uncharacterized protein YydD (DUF2326 family)
MIDSFDVINQTVKCDEYEQIVFTMTKLTDYFDNKSQGIIKLKEYINRISNEIHGHQRKKSAHRFLWETLLQSLNKNSLNSNIIDVLSQKIGLSRRQIRDFLEIKGKDQLFKLKIV